MSKGTSSPGPSLPARPDLEWYRKAARKKLKQLRARDSKARLADAQLAIAREHGFASWRKLKAAIESPGGAKAPAVFSAVESGNLAEVRRLLDRGADFEARGEAGNIGRCTPLHLACFLGSDRDAMVRLLLERGADPNVTSSEGCTPLFDAVRHDQRAIADALLAAGARATIFEAVGLDRPDLVEPMLAADPDAIARKHPYTKVTPWAFARSQRMRELLRATGAGPTIHEAAELGWTDEVRRQLDRAPALVDSRSEKGQTPLHHAVDWNRIETARLLLERGADPLAPWTPGPGWTALQLSEQRNRAEMIELIKSHKISMSVDTQTVLAALMKAIASRNFDAVKTLAGKVPSLLNMTGPHPMWGGRPQPLHVSIETGALEIFQLLLDSGADPSGDNREYDGWSPLMLAVHWKRDAMRDELLRRGARVGLIEALMLGDDSRLRAILRNEPEALKHPIPNNATPLHFAQTTRAARMLLEAGVKPDARDKYGRTAIESIAGRGKQSKRLVQSLSTATGAAPAPRTLAAVGDLAQLRKAAAKDAKIVHDPEVLHDAIEHGHLPIVRWLLDAGADVNARTARGSKATPLHAAAWHGNLPVVKLLVDRGADLVAVDEQYKTTPATWARTALERLDRTSCLDVAEFLEHSASSEDGAAQRLVRAMERAQFESPAFIDRHFDYAGATPRWEPLEIQSPTLRESEADKAITKFAQLGPHRLLSVWMQVEVASDGRITALPNSPPTRTVEYFRGGEAGQRPRGGQWRHLDWAPTRRGWARNPGAWDDLAEAIALLRSRNLPPGRYRVVTLRRMLHARHEKGQLKIIKKHSYGPNLQGPS